MKIKDFLNDNLPVAKGSIQIPIKSLISEYHQRYSVQNAIKGKGRFSHIVYKTNKTDRTIIHVKVPSDTVPGFYYDVLFEIQYEPTTMKLEDCDVKIFSNAPSFVYTYAYIFYHLDMGEGKKPGMMIDQLTGKIPKDRLMIQGTEKKLPGEVRKNPPVVRNTLGLPLWDKSLYYAVFYLTEEVNFLSIKSRQTKITERELLNQVKDFNTLMAERKREEKKYRERTSAVRKKINKSIRKSELKVRKANNPMKSIKPIQVKQPIKPKAPNRTKSSRK